VAGDVSAGFRFASSARFRYEFRDVTSKLIERHQVQPLLRDLVFGNVLDSWISRGTVHIALEYLYAKRIILRHADGGAFDAETTAALDELVKVNSSAKMRRDGAGFITFTAEGDGAAFAYKALQIFRYDGKLDIGIQAKTLGKKDTSAEPMGYVPAHGEFLDVVSESKAPS
jgi:hypothetical protein